MGFWDHLDELRGTIIKSVAVFIVFAVLIGYYLTQFNRLLMWPFHRAATNYPNLAIELVTATPMEGFNVIIEMCMFGGLMLAAPFILFFVGQFVAPALTAKETKAVLPVCFAAFGLFLAGAAFAFFLLVPSAMHVFIQINESLEWGFRWTVGSYYTILSRTVIGVGATFQFPLLILLLVWLGIVNTGFLRKYRRHAVVAIFVVAMIVTPSTDPFIQVMVAAPLYVLYEISIIFSARLENRRERSGGAVLIALLALLPFKRRASTAVLELGRHA
jgi:sec-independent protein translocase protein TatC